MFISIEDKQTEEIEGFCFTESTIYQSKGKVAKVTLPDELDIFYIMSPRYNIKGYDKAMFYIQDIDKLIECLQAVKKHVEAN